MKHIGSWEIDTGSLAEILRQALDAGEIGADDIIWGGPSGDAVIAPTPFEIEGTDYDEYLDEGTVAEYLAGMA